MIMIMITLAYLFINLFRTKEYGGNDTQFVLEFDQFIEYCSQDARNPA